MIQFFIFYVLAEHLVYSLLIYPSFHTSTKNRAISFISFPGITFYVQKAAQPEIVAMKQC